MYNASLGVLGLMAVIISPGTIIQFGGISKAFILFGTIVLILLSLFFFIVLFKKKQSKNSDDKSTKKLNLFYETPNNITARSREIFLSLYWAALFPKENAQPFKTPPKYFPFSEGRKTS